MSFSDAGISSCTAEAMASGLPVIITNTGENEKWIKDGEDGFLIPTKDPDILAQKIIYLIKNKNEKTRLGKNGRKIIEERDNYYREMEKMEKLYCSILNSG